MPRQRRRSNRFIHRRLFIVYEVEGIVYRVSNVSLNGFNRPNSRTIVELEKLLAQHHGKDEDSVIITDYKVM